MANLNTRAQSEYFRRPRDQQYASLESLYAAVCRDTVEHFSRVKDVTIKATDYGDIVLESKDGIYSFSHFSFGQFVGDVLALPAQVAEYTREIPAELSVPVLAYAQQQIGEQNALLYVDKSRDQLRAVNRPSYGRILDRQIVEKLMEFTADHPEFSPPPGWRGNDDCPLYASDRDMFAMVINGGSIVNVPSNRAGEDNLYLGIMVWNSEVGDGGIGCEIVSFRECCGNHCLHGVEKSTRVAFKHSANAPQRLYAEMIPAMESFMLDSPRYVKQLEDMSNRALSFKLPADEKDKIELLTSKKIGLSKGQADRSILRAIAEEGDANTAWSVANGITSIAKDVIHYDARSQLQHGAARLLSLASA